MGQIVRVGVVADTHCPEFLDRLPASLFAGLRGVDLILHAGDVGGPSTLERLGEVAPVQAVRGDHDGTMRELPLWREITLDGRRIVVVHGNRTRLMEEPATLVGTLSLGTVWPAPDIARHLKRRHPTADVILYGHTHRARAEIVGGTLVFNPGAVYQVGKEEALVRLRRRPNWFEWCWLQVIRHRMDRPVPSYGLLEIGPDGVRARVLPLRR